MHFKCQSEQSYLHSRSQGLYISIIKRSRNTYIFVARSIKFPSFRLKFLAIFSPRFSLRSSKILRNVTVCMGERYSFEGVEIHEGTLERGTGFCFFFRRCNRRGISFFFESKGTTACCWDAGEKSRCCKIEWASIKYNNRWVWIFMDERAGICYVIFTVLWYRPGTMEARGWKTVAASVPRVTIPNCYHIFECD